MGTDLLRKFLKDFLDPKVSRNEISQRHSQNGAALYDEIEAHADSLKRVFGIGCFPISKFVNTDPPLDRELVRGLDLIKGDRVNGTGPKVGPVRRILVYANGDIS